MAFLFVEIAFIQKFMRFLHHPVFIAAVVLASFLVFAGLGSFWSRRYSTRCTQRAGMLQAATGIVLATLLAIHFGFLFVVALAQMLYAVSVFVFPATGD